MATTPKTKPAAKHTIKPAAKLPRKKHPTPVTDKINAVGLDAICAKLMSGMWQSEIAKEIGVSTFAMFTWTTSTPEITVRVNEARRISALHWDEKAEAVLKSADVSVNGSIAQARELAQHYRWRASKYSPKEYGDKLDVTAEVTVSDLSDEQLKAKAIALAARLGMSRGKDGE